MTSGKLYLRLLEYVRPYWRIFLVAVASMAVVAASEPAFPALLKPLLDGSFVNKDPASIRMVPPLLIGLFLLRGVFTFISAYAIAWVANRLVMDLRALMFHKMVNLPTRYYDNTSSGAAIANVAFNVSQVADAGTNVITVLVRDTLTVVGLLGWIFYLNWKLSLIALAIAPVIVLIVRSFSGRLRRMSRGAQHSMGDITHVLEESLEGHKVVKIFGGQEYEYRRFREAANRVRLFNMKQTVASAANVPLVQLVAATALAIIIYIATMQSAANQTTVGGFVSFITAMLMLLAPIKRLTGINESLQRGLAAAEIVFDLIDQPSEPDSGTIVLEQAKGELEFRQMSFNYEGVDAPALHDISLRIAPGETIALVGASGGGKTTLVNLIPLLYHPGGGKIFLDGHDIETIKLASLRDNIALVSQDVVLFNDTIAANIAYGRRNQASGAEIAAAAEAANAMEFISAMPQGLQTEVGENGVRLSGGQRQRIAIARALLKDAPILILDEATSALDSQSEQHVQAALERLMQGRTTLVIAHRLSTIEKADRIIVLQKGRIAEIGSHHELLARDGIYANLYRIQFAQQKDQA
ncbi:MAG: lipid A export permease/ATP-binding protein MsbA [Sulfuricella sp.]